VYLSKKLVLRTMPAQIPSVRSSKGRARHPPQSGNGSNKGRHGLSVLTRKLPKKERPALYKTARCIREKFSFGGIPGRGSILCGIVLRCRSALRRACITGSAAHCGPFPGCSRRFSTEQERPLFQLSLENIRQQASPLCRGCWRRLSPRAALRDSADRSISAKGIILPGGRPFCRSGPTDCS
jgi:hypothetical protein